MSSTLIATIAGLVTAVLWGAGDWLTAKSSKKFDIFETFFVVELAGLIIVLPILLLSNQQIPTLSQFSILAGASLLFTVAYLMFIEALSKGAVGIVVPLSNTYALVTLVLSLIFLGSTFTNRQIGAMFGIALGAVILAYEKNHKKIPIKELHRETVLCICASLGWGTALFLINPLVDQLSWQVITGTLSIFMTSLSFLILVMYKKPKPSKLARSALRNRYGIAAGVLLTLGTFAFYSGSEKTGNLLIPAVISSGGPLVAAYLSAMFDKERLGAHKRIGAVVIVAGIVILNY
jgi:drug/metabolite transporter (DMT)-like permease